MAAVDSSEYFNQPGSGEFKIKSEIQIINETGNPEKEPNPDKETSHLGLNYLKKNILQLAESFAIFIVRA